MGQDSARRKLVAENFSQNYKDHFLRLSVATQPAGADHFGRPARPPTIFTETAAFIFLSFFFLKTQFVLPFFDAGGRATPLGKFLAQIA
jgi:hypothetical protein